MAVILRKLTCILAEIDIYQQKLEHKASMIFFKLKIF
jgi:hypothetical protein